MNINDLLNMPDPDHVPDTINLLEAELEEFLNLVDCSKHNIVLISGKDNSIYKKLRLMSLIINLIDNGDTLALPTSTDRILYSSIESNFITELKSMIKTDSRLYCIFGFGQVKEFLDEHPDTKTIVIFSDSPRSLTAEFLLTLANLGLQVFILCVNDNTGMMLQYTSRLIFDLTDTLKVTKHRNGGTLRQFDLIYDELIN